MASVLRLGLCAAVCAYAIAARAAFTDPTQIQTEAYIHLVQGDQSLDSGRLDEALEHYTLSRDFYLQIADEFPDYQPRIVAYRADYCSDQIDLLLLRLGNAPASKPASPPTPPSTNSSLPPKERDTQHATRAGNEESVASSLPPEEPTLLAAAPSTPKLQKKPKKAPPKSSNPAAPVSEPETPPPPESDPDLLTDLQDQIAALAAQRDALSAQVNALSEQLSEAQARATRAEDALLHQHDEPQAEQSPFPIDDPVDQPISEPVAEIADDIADDSMALPVEPIAEPANEPISETANGIGDALTDETSNELAETPSSKTLDEPTDEPAGDSTLEATGEITDGIDWPQTLAAIRHHILAGNAAAVLPLFDDLPTPPDDVRLPLVCLRSVALVRLGQAPEAIELFTPFAADHDANADFYAALGNALLAAGRYTEARAALLRATKLSRALPPETYANLALLYADTSPKNLRSARKNYQKALTLGLPPVPSLAALLD